MSRKTNKNITHNSVLIIIEMINKIQMQKNNEINTYRMHKTKVKNQLKTQLNK